MKLLARAANPSGMLKDGDREIVLRVEPQKRLRNYEHPVVLRGVNLLCKRVKGLNRSLCKIKRSAIQETRIVEHGDQIHVAETVHKCPIAEGSVYPYGYKGIPCIPENSPDGARGIVPANRNWLTNCYDCLVLD
ncbi:MAG: hypothetical protein IBJ03_01430 [Gemmatimonadaceae bacterium]|nr:hypothetical protein [Gemmatimonadaceae bacterium]